MFVYLCALSEKTLFFMQFICCDVIDMIGLNHGLKWGKTKLNLTTSFKQKSYLCIKYKHSIIKLSKKFLINFKQFLINN